MSFFQSLLMASSRPKDAFLVIGDSIFAGGNALASSTLPTPGYAYEFYNGALYPVGLSGSVAPAAETEKSPWPKFCSDYFADTRRIPLIINRGFSSSTISTANDNNDWQTSGNHYNDAVTAANDALTLTGISQLTAIFIDLGINDVQNLNGTGSFTVAQINTFLGNIITNLNTDFPGVPILYTQIGRSTTILVNSRLTGVRNSIKNYCISNAGVHFAGSLSAFQVGNLYEDDIHPDQVGNDYLGGMYARWFRNSSFSKWTRSLIACHFDEPSTNEKNAIATFLTSWETEYLNMDWFYNMKQSTRENTAFDWAFLSAPEADGGFAFTANDSIRTSSSSLFWLGNNQLNSIVNMSQNDYAIEIKIKTNHTGAGVDGVCMGISNAATTSNTYLRQTTTLIGWAPNENVIETYAVETSLVAGSWLFRRSASTTTALFLNGASVDTGANASLALQNLNFVVGARNVNGTPAGNIDLSVLRCIGIQNSAISNMSNFITALDTMQSSY